MKIPNINNIFNGSELVEVTFPSFTSSLGFLEYDGILNNAESVVSSSQIMRADYINVKTPQNIDQLLSGSAQRFPINDSNYSSYLWRTPRYDGSKTISANYNKYNASGSNILFADGTIGSWTGDQNLNTSLLNIGNPLGKVPSVDLYSTHMVLFDKIDVDQGFDNNDIFHLLYLIDDQGNKVPLSYRNRNLIDIQRLFKIGTNAEVIFLGPNTQNIQDSYPIIRVGEKFQNIISIKNDMWTYTSLNNEWSISPNIFFLAQPISTNNVLNINLPLFNRKLRLFSNNNNITASTGITEDVILKNKINGYSFLEPIPFSNLLWSPFNTGSFGGTTATNGALIPELVPYGFISDKLSFWYKLLYDPTTQTAFKGTILEHQISDVEFKGYQNNGINQGLGAVSDILDPRSEFNNDAPLTIGNILNLYTYDSSSTTFNTPSFPAPPEYSPEDTIGSTLTYSIKVTDIQFPISQSYEAISIGNNISNIILPFYTTSSNEDYGWFIGLGKINGYGNNTGSAMLWQAQALGTTGNPINPNTLIMNISTCSLSAGNTRTASVDNSIVFRDFFDSLTMGDLIHTKRHNINLPEGLKKTFMILKNCGTSSISRQVNSSPATYANSKNAYQFVVQQISGETWYSMAGNSGAGYGLGDFTTTEYIYKIDKLDQPYIEGSILNQGVTPETINNTLENDPVYWTVSKTIPHEQYIESQYLVGTGVGVLIPDNYSPSLREQVPDILAKTKIDIGNLIQNQ